jgi:cell division septum initiation protein DivIVA
LKEEGKGNPTKNLAKPITTTPMTELDDNQTTQQRLTALEERLERFDDVVAQRCLAVLDVADELNRQTNERIDRLTVEVTRLAESVRQLVATSNADRLIMLRILQYLENQYEGNGKADE